MSTATVTFGHEVKEVELSQIQATQGTERLRDIETLAKSIAAVGLQIPLIVQRVAADQYRLVDGHRRFAALKKNKTKTARVIEIDSDISDDKMGTIQLTANLHRLQLTAFEEAAAIKKLRDDGRDTRDIAADLGLTPQAVARREQLNKLTPEWLKYIASMREGTALSVAAFEMIASYEPSVQGKLLQSYMRSSHVPTVNDVKRELSAFDRTLKSAPWNLDDAILFPTAGACNVCPKRSSCQSLLFDGEVEGKKASPEDKCLDIACWNKKLEKFGRQKLEAAKAKHPNLVLIANSGWGQSVDVRIVKGVSGGQKVFKTQGYGWAGNEFESAKKTDKDAVPAMRVNEKGLGAITYVRIKKETKAAAPTKQAAKRMTPEETAKRQAEELQARREQWIREKIESHIGFRSNPPANFIGIPPREMIQIIGMSLICSDRSDFKDMDKWRKLDFNVAVKEIWKLLCEQLYVDNWASLRPVCEHLLGLNWSDLEADAVKAIPDPTPKAGAKKAGKK